MEGKGLLRGQAVGGTAQSWGAWSSACPVEVLGNGGCSSGKCFLGWLVEGELSLCLLMTVAVGDGSQLCFRVAYARKVPLTTVLSICMA